MFDVCFLEIDTTANQREAMMDTRTLVTGHVLSGSVTIGKVNTKTLVVGQDVYMFSGVYGNTGKVVKVTPLGVDVQTADEVLHFDTNGRSYVTELQPSYDPTAHPLSPWRWDGNGTYECGPWELDDMPFAERTALLEQRWADWRRKMEEENVRIKHFVLWQVDGDMTRSAPLQVYGTTLRFHELQRAENLAAGLNKSMNSGITSAARFTYRVVSQSEIPNETANMEEFEFKNSPLHLEICERVARDYAPVRVFSDFRFVEAPNGIACAFSLVKNPYTRDGDNLIEIKDEKLLEKLRSVKGQYVHGGFPVFYYEHLMSTADLGKVFMAGAMSFLSEI